MSRHRGTHSSRLSLHGSHMTTHGASIRFRCRLSSWLRKKSSSVSFFRSLPNHSGSAVSRWHTTVRNLPFLPPVDFVYPHLSERRLAPLCVPPLQVPQIDGSHRAFRQPHPSRHLPRRRT